MSQNKRTELAELGEFGLIEALTKGFTNQNKESILGIGDDAAILDFQNQQVVVSTDMLVEGMHFDLSYTPLKHLGFKAVAVNVSDICAMNARPTQITVSIGVSNRFSVEALQEFYEGVHEACKAYNVDLVGGDTVSSLKGFIISVTALGCAPAQQLVRRNGAQVGDILCASGNLGSAYIGLQILEREKMIFKEHQTLQPQLEEHQYCISRLLKPEARLDIIQTLQKANVLPTSMIDLSDGLSSEINHLCKQSNVGAIVEDALLSIHEKTYETASMTFNIDPTNCALFGGEDYELLFTLNPKDLEAIRYMPDVKIIGEITPPQDGIKLQTKSGKLHDLVPNGWTHFS